MSEKKYPIGGYAPGNHQCHCGTCGGGFIGDKRAYQCKPCAVRDFEKFDALSPTEQDELMKRNAAVIREMFSKWSNKPNMSEQLTPGPPTATGTYFAVIKCYVSDDPQMCILHYQAHKNLYRAVGHAFNVEVKAKDVVGYVGEQGQHGAVWVKCSDRLPGWKKRVKWRDGNNYSYATDGEISFFEMEKPNLDGWEWLDEGAAAGREEVLQRIKDLNLSDVDAPVFTHTKEFEAHFSYIKGKLMDLIKQQKEK